MASRYPPTPSFGGPFLGFPLQPSQIQNNASNVSAGRSLGPAPMPVQPTSTPSPALNLSSFETNAQIPHSASAVSLPNFPPPPPFPPELLRQFANSNLPLPPPPSLPPMPIPHLGFSPFPGTTQPFTPSNGPPHSSSVGTPVVTNIINRKPSPTEYSGDTYEPSQSLQAQVGPGREEGELSDGELEDSLAVSTGRSSPSPLKEDTAAVPMSSVDSASSYHAIRLSDPLPTPPVHSIPISPRQPAGGFASNQHSHIHTDVANTMGNVFQRQPREDAEQILSAEEDSGSSYNPPSASTPELPQESSDQTQSVPVEFRPNAKPTTSSVQVKADRSFLSHKKPSELRDLAKGALLSLAPHNIRYSELVREGVDPRLLRQLYEELGIKDAGEELMTNTSGLTKNLQNSVAPTESDNELTKEQQPLSSTKSTSLKANNPAAKSNLNGIAHFPASQNLPNPLPPKPDIEHKQPDQPQVVKESAQAEVKRAPPLPVEPAASIAMERKDRIAQLLAAKTGKTIMAHSTSDKTPPTQLPPPVPPLAAITSLSPAPQNQVLEATSPSPTPPIKAQQTPKSKSKAQTELVRQKMDSLRREALAKAQAQSLSQTSATLHHNETSRGNLDTTSDSNDSKQSSRISDQVDDLISQASPAHVSTSAIDTRPIYASRIPGLFMTTAEVSTPETDIGSMYESPPEFHRHISSPQAGAGARQDSFNSVPQIDAVGTPSEPANQSPENHSSKLRQGQKRPLAADSFDEPRPPAKRPFGRKDSYDQVEIVVSDDESEEGSEEVQMDLDGESELEIQETRTTFVEATPRKEALRNLPPLTDFPSPRPFLPSTPYASTAALTPGKEKAAEDLFRAKSQEIEAMRRKIAEMEERRKAKLNTNQALSPRPSAPESPPTAKTPSPPNTEVSQAILRPGMTGEVEVGVLSTTPENLSHGTTQLEDASRLRPSFSSASKDLSRAEALRLKLLRKKVLKDGLPDLNAEVQRTRSKLMEVQSRLAQTKQEVERREAELHEARRLEAEIVEEATRLEEQLKKGLYGRDRFSQELQTLSHDLETMPEEENTTTSPGVYDREVLNASSAPTREESPAEASATSTQYTASPSAVSSAHVPEDPPSPSNIRAQGVEGPATVAHQPAIDAEVDVMIENGDDRLHSEDDTGRMKRESGSILLGKKLRSTSQSLVDGPSHQSPSITADISENDLSSGIATQHASPLETPGHTPEGVDEYDGSVSMSDSGSDDYEPAEPVQPDSNYTDDRSDGYDPEEDNSLVIEEKSEDVDEVDDDYEPAEPTESLGGSSNSPRSSVNPGDDEKSVVVDGTEAGAQSAEANTVVETQDFVPAADGDDVIDDDLQDVDKPKSHFVPYSSPLAYMKSLRFHPQFSEQVPGGYRSLTYSNNIDPRRPLCPTELAGEVCNDPQCEEQHFQQMGLPDDKILVQMSSANDIKDKDERDRYVLGLKQVIADLRLQGVKDFARVASELAAYRRRFREEQESTLA